MTHVHNAHRRWAPRDPGLGGVALVRGDVVVMAIVDGVHLAPEAALLAALAARGRFALVTDAMEAAGLGTGPTGSARARSRSAGPRRACPTAPSRAAC